VLLLSQLNRDADDRQRPKLRDLKASGDLEQDADQVILLHREPGPAAEKTRINALVEKNRHGPVGEAALTFHGPYLTFGDYEIPFDVFEKGV
jgi:replicative DNA helicase